MAHIKIKYLSRICDYTGSIAPENCGEYYCNNYKEKGGRDENGFHIFGVCKYKGTTLDNILEFNTKNYSYEEEYEEGIKYNKFTSRKTGTVYPYYLKIDNQIICGDPEGKEG